MNRTRGLRTGLIGFLVGIAGLWAFAAGAEAAPEAQGEILRQAMVQAMIQARIETKTATRLATQQAFMAEVVLDAALEQDRLRSGQETEPARLQQHLSTRAHQVGTAVGTSLAAGVKAYGEQNALQVMATVMSATRAGMGAQAASETAEALASSGYSLQEMSRVMQHTMERVRAEVPEDGGAALALQVRSMTRTRMTAQAMLGALDGSGPGQSANGGQGGTKGGSGSAGSGSGGSGSGGGGQGGGSGGSGSGGGKGGQ